MKDAGDWIADNFRNVREDIPLVEACKNLLAAAKSGLAADRERATKQVEIVARHHNWMEPG